uniref:Glucose-methanol-choline oxidoreductase N-terminal domain-containing protein n=1 Tax=Timema cristinae TaxID=61476 RepID=A0A7R9D4F4_TIMCR|nr:unnamed protein product [Timema cristinae]
MLKAFKEMEADFNGEQQGVVVTAVTAQYTLHKGKRWFTNNAFLKPVRYIRSNLKVVTNVRITKILINSSSKKAYGVEYKMNNELSSYYIATTKKEVILSAGAINFPQILIISGIGPKTVLDYFDFGIALILDLKIRFNLQDHVTSSDVEFILNENTQQIYLSICCHQLDPWPQPELSKQLLSIIVVLLQPKSRGRVKLDSNDPLTNALIYSNYFAEEIDIQSLIKGLLFGVKLSRTNSLISKGYTLITDFLTFGTEPYWRCALRTNTKSINHPGGTCKMGPYNNTDLVVDPQLKVYGIANLRVVE